MNTPLQQNSPRSFCREISKFGFIIARSVFILNSSYNSNVNKKKNNNTYLYENRKNIKHFSLKSSVHFVSEL